MNLIEQLGGYEAAKEKLVCGFRILATRLSYETTIVGKDGEKQNVITGVYLEDLEKALLQYRREYNIYEVGDLIMYEDELCEIKYIHHERKARVTDGFWGRTIYDFPNGIRHATDEEIANNARSK